MNPLFETSPVIDRRLESVVQVLLSSLPNSKPRKDSKCYLRVAGWVGQIYSGTFLVSNRFDESKDSQYDMNGVCEKVRACKGDWLAVRNLVVESLANFEEAKKPEKMPWSKKYLEKITFSTYFSNGRGPSGLMDCPFLKFVNKPKDSYSHVSDLTIQKLKKECVPFVRSAAERICSKHFKMKAHQLSFWYNMQDWSRWFELLKKTFPEAYGEMLVACSNMNPLEDFYERLLSQLRQKQGEKPVVSHWNFKLNWQDGTELDGQFKTWLLSGIQTGKFGMLKNLPKPITLYYTNESFESSVCAKKPEKAVVNLEDFVF